MNTNTHSEQDNIIDFIKFVSKRGISLKYSKYARTFGTFPGGMRKELNEHAFQDLFKEFQVEREEYRKRL